MINKIGTNKVANTYLTNNDKRKTEAEKITETKNDIVEIGYKPADSSTYKKPNKLSNSEINAVKAEAERINSNLISLVQKLFLKQGNYSKTLISEDNSVELSKLAISENGEYGIKTLSDNIVNFAIAVCDNDTGKLDEIKTAIDKGFSEAEKAFGGQLPDICYKTHDEIMKKLDTWAKDD